MSHTPTFAELLKCQRVHARLSQEELAERAGLSARAISDLERGPDRVPRSTSVRLLAGALRLSKEEREAFEAAARGEAAPAESPTGRSHDLPLQLTPFVGRERGVRALRATLLQADDLGEVLGIGELPMGEGYQTLAGFVLSELGRIRNPGDQFDRTSCRLAPAPPL